MNRVRPSMRTAGLIAVAVGFMGAGAASWVVVAQPEEQQKTPAPVSALPAEPPKASLTPEEEQFYRDVAREAWAYLDGNYVAATGLVKATPDWAYTTIWDVGAQILAFKAAQELGLLPTDEYHR